MSNTKASKRAEKYAEDASKWHQGSGVHADQCAEAAILFENLAQECLRTAALWADAAKAEAADLQGTRGEWVNYIAWTRTKLKSKELLVVARGIVNSD